MGCWAHILAAVREVLCVYKVRESSAWRQVHSSSLRLIFQVLGLGFPILPKKRAFRNGWCWGLAHLSGCLGCDIFLPFFFSDSVLHFAHHCERIHPLSCGRSLCSCVSLCFPIKWINWFGMMGCPGEREISNEAFMVRGEK